MHDEWAERGIDISEQYTAGLPKTMADPDRLGRAVNETVRFMADRLAHSGGLISIRTLSADEGQSARLEVADNAPRPEASLLQAISRPGVYSCAGSEGLFGAKRIVHAHTGRIEAVCPPSGGLRIAIVMPAAQPQSVSPSPPEPPGDMPFDLPDEFPPAAFAEGQEEPFDAAASPVASIAPPHAAHERYETASGPAAYYEPAQATATAEAGGKATQTYEEPSARTVLVVDDDANVREILQQVLDMRGYSVRTATDGVEAMAQITVDSVDLVLLDLMMPRKSGLDVLAELRMRRDAPPIIVMTGSKNPDYIREALHNGARACLQKPFELRELLSTVESVLAT